VEAWRAVESQHQVATRKLVDTLDEQALLEEMIESVKPPDPTGGRFHYLLATPFRYPPLRHGSRFGTRHEPGIWYGAEARRTALAEVAYYRLLFLEGTEAELGTVETPLSVFRIRIDTPRGVDLVRPPFDAHRRTIASRTRYTVTQALGRAMRAAGVEAFRYPSARDRGPRGGVGVAAFTPRVFGRRQPGRLESWYCAATRRRVELRRRDYFDRPSYVFERKAFEVGGRLPVPAL